MPPHSVSKLEYLGFRFVPEKENIPQITGWSDLDGIYSFKFVPGPKATQDMQQKAPALFEMIDLGRKTGNASWHV